MRYPLSWRRYGVWRLPWNRFRNLTVEPEIPSIPFNSFLEAAPDAVVIIDQNGTIVRVNGQAEKMFGYAREELMGQELEMLMPLRLVAVTGWAQAADKQRSHEAGFNFHVAKPVELSALEKLLAGF